MSQTVITQAFETLKAQEAANGGIVTLDEFVFASVPNLNITDPIDRTEGLPPAAQIVHRQAVSKTGMVNSNAVVYSVVLGADVGDFEFNWVGLLNKASGVVAMIVHAPSQKKIRTQSGQQGNVLTRSFLMEYNGASQQTQIITPADTWQIDFTARLNGVDERIRLENIDTYGAAAFLGDGFKVSKNGSKYVVKQGVAYIAGLRAELLFDQDMTVSARPSKIWVDVCWQGTMTSVWAAQTKLTVAETLADYTDSDTLHHVFAVAEILADGSVKDLRPVSFGAALAKVSPEKNTVPYFDDMAMFGLTPLSEFVRGFFDKSSPAAAREYLELSQEDGAESIGYGDESVAAALDKANNKLGFVSHKTTYAIPGDFADWTAAAAFFQRVGYWGEKVTVNIAAGIYTWDTLPVVFGREWGDGRILFKGAGRDITIIQFDKRDGIYARGDMSFGRAAQFPVAGGDLDPILKDVTLSGISRDTGIDDPYKDAMGLRVFDGAVIVLDQSVRITQFSRAGVMAERKGQAFVPGILVDTTGSDCFAASEAGYIYAPDTTADNPRGHCYIGYSGGQIYMPNSTSKNAAMHGDSDLGGSGVVVTGKSYVYAIYHNATGHAQRPVSVAIGSVCRADYLTESGNALPVTVSHHSLLVAPNATLHKPNELALLIEKGGQVNFQVATGDKFTINGRVSVLSMGTLHAPDGTITNSSGNSLTAVNSSVDIDRTIFHGAPAVAIYAQDGARVKCVGGESQTTTGTSIISQNAEVSADNFKVKGSPSNGFRATASGRIYAKNSSVERAAQYGYTAENMGSFIDATGATVGDAFTGFRGQNGGQINALNTVANGVYTDAPYKPAVNVADNRLTLIIN